MTHTGEPLYEYACHEGNYSMATALSGARSGPRGRWAVTAAKPLEPTKEDP